MIILNGLVGPLPSHRRPSLRGAVIQPSRCECSVGNAGSDCLFSRSSCRTTTTTVTGPYYSNGQLGFVAVVFSDSFTRRFIFRPDRPAPRLLSLPVDTVRDEEQHAPPPSSRITLTSALLLIVYPFAPSSWQPKNACTRQSRPRCWQPELPQPSSESSSASIILMA